VCRGCGVNWLITNLVTPSKVFQSLRKLFRAGIRQKDVVRKVRDGLIFVAKRNGLLSSLYCHTQREESNPLGEITMELRLVFQIPESGLTINGLIGGLREGVGQIHGAIVVNLMKALEERLISAVLQSEPGRYQRNGRQSKPRYLKSSLGTLPYRFAQLRDRQGRRSFMPLVEALAIPAYDHYLEEALEPGIGLTVHVSYRRASSEVERIRGVSMSHTTVHRSLQELAGRHDPFGSMKDRAFRFLLVDGTKVHLQGPLGKDLGQVEKRWALASLGSLSRFEPVGFWIDTAWALRREPCGLREAGGAVLRRGAGDRGESFTPRHEAPALSVARQEGVSLFFVRRRFQKSRAEVAGGEASIGSRDDSHPGRHREASSRGSPLG
jgi:hypothetical protein